jgi:DNA-binding response OmpR family regulator
MINGEIPTAKKVLVVDDDVEIAQMMETVLKSRDYYVVVVHDGLRAVEKTNTEHIDLILLDVHLPLFSGLWFCNAFKNKPNTKNIPVIIISGFLDEETAKKAYEVGAAAALRKPFNSQELLEVVERHLR